MVKHRLQVAAEPFAIFGGFVIMHPEEYPMNLSWLHGKITVELAEEKYPLWAQEELAKIETGPAASEPAESGEQPAQ